MKISKLISFAMVALLLIVSACNKEDDPVDSTDTTTSVDVKSSNFLSGGLVEAITTETRTMSDGSTAECYKIVVNSLASDHNMGPWCPSNISDDASKGGIWLEGGEVYDVDGAFVQNMATFYNDNTWMMYDANTGDITKTTTQADCQAAANPNVGTQYQNYCVECLPSYVANLSHTYYIPITPTAASSPIAFGTGPQSTGPTVRGIAFNGVVFDAPAPTSAILGAYTLAPFDDAGGHINMTAGYHYHAATGMTTQIAQADAHSAMIGYALDGYGIYERLDANGDEYTDLDASRGHSDDTRGYHYHADKAGNNNFINSLHGIYAQ